MTDARRALAAELDPLRDPHRRLQRSGAAIRAGTGEILALDGKLRVRRPSGLLPVAAAGVTARVGGP
ncbi:hypothetical protein D3C83_125700 [compost metagenome]